MQLIKTNKRKKRSVYFDGEFYYKVWNYSKPEWIDQHVQLVDRFAPGLIVDYSYTDCKMKIVLNRIPGETAFSVRHSESWMKRIHEACVQNLTETYPYAHCDWVLSNVIITPDSQIRLIDWDNLQKSTVSWKYTLRQLKKDLSKGARVLF